MSDTVFKSSLSIEEIERNFAETDYFSELMDALEEALAYSRRNTSNEPHVNNCAN